jgi:hypothetical protein
MNIDQITLKEYLEKVRGETLKRFLEIHQKAPFTDEEKAEFKFFNDRWHIFYNYACLYPDEPAEYISPQEQNLSSETLEFISEVYADVGGWINPIEEEPIVEQKESKKLNWETIPFFRNFIKTHPENELDLDEAINSREPQRELTRAIGEWLIKSLKPSEKALFNEISNTFFSQKSMSVNFSTPISAGGHAFLGNDKDILSYQTLAFSLIITNHLFKANRDSEEIIRELKDLKNNRREIEYLTQLGIKSGINKRNIQKFFSEIKKLH